VPLRGARAPHQQGYLAGLEMQHGLAPQVCVGTGVQPRGGLEPLDAPPIAGQGALEKGRVAMLVPRPVGIAGRVQKPPTSRAMTGDSLRPSVQAVLVEALDGLGHEPVMVP